VRAAVLGLVGACLAFGLGSACEAQVARAADRAAAAAAEHRQRGLGHLEQGRLDAALAEFRQALALDPRDAVSSDRIGVVLAESGQVEAAAAEFERAIGLDPRLPDPHFHLGLAHDRSGRTQEAIARYHEALWLKPDFVEAAYGLNAICARLGDLEGAVRLLRRVVHTSPRFAEAWYNLGANLWNGYRTSVGLRQKRDLEDAVAALETARQLEPKQARIHFALGQILAEMHKFEPALESLHRASELAAGDPGYAYNLGLALRLAGDLDAAEAQLRAAIAGEPAHARARRALGLVLREKGELEASIVELRRSVAELPGDPEGLHALGALLLKLSDVSGAIEALQQAIRIDPRLAEARVNLGQALLKSGRRDEAQAQIAEVERLKAEQAGVGRAMILVETAASHSAKGERAAAVERLREAAAASPELSEAQYRLGLALLEHSPPDPAGAEVAFLRVLQLDPNHAGARHRFGGLLARRGDAREGAFQFRRALEIRPSLVDAHRELARIALRSREWAAAAVELKAVLAWEPTDATARDELAKALKAR